MAQNGEATFPRSHSYKVVDSGLLKLTDSGTILPKKAATSHPGPFYCKVLRMKNPVPRWHEPHFKDSTVTCRPVAPMLDRADTEHFHQLKKF